VRYTVYALPGAVIEIGFITDSLTVSEGDGVVSEISVGILGGGTTEQDLDFNFVYNFGSESLVDSRTVPLLSESA
jgi:hypothetical protein